MLECLVLGDSIAAGVGGARPECATTARVGITSGTYINELFPLTSHTAQTAVISLGVNDDPSMDTIGNLRQVRGALRVGTVVWLLPGLKENVRDAIRTVASEYGDQLIDTRPQAGADHLHPSGAGYRLIASETLAPGTAGGEAPRNEEVAFAPMPMPRAVREREGFTLGTGGSSRYRLHVVFRGKLQQMADLRLQLAHQQAGITRGTGTHVTFATHATYGALPQPGYAYAAYGTGAYGTGTRASTNSGAARSFTSAPMPAGSTSLRFTPEPITR